MKMMKTDDESDKTVYLCKGCDIKLDNIDSYRGQYCAECYSCMRRTWYIGNKLTKKRIEGWRSRQTCMVCGEPETIESPLFIVTNCSVRNLSMKVFDSTPCVHLACLKEIQQGKTRKRKKDKRVIQQTKVNHNGRNRWK